jgi:putative transposase
MWTSSDRKKYAPDDRRYQSDLTDAEWDIVSPLFLGYFTYTADLREMTNACLYLEKTGCQWRFLPKDFGAWQTVRTWHDTFHRDGIWQKITDLLHREVRTQNGKNSEPSTAIIDSQSVPSGPQAGDRGFDGHKKIKGIKRHVLTCSLGFVIAIVVTIAAVHDTKAVPELLQRACDAGYELKRVLADGIYTGSYIDKAAAQHKVDIQIASRNAEAARKGFVPQPIRWRIEATFGTCTNRYRRLTRNLEHSPEAAENAFKIANARRLLANYNRNIRKEA